MGKILKFTKPTGSSEVDHMLIGFYEAIEALVPMNQPGVMTVELTDQGLKLTPVVSGSAGQRSVGMSHKGEWVSDRTYAVDNVVSRGALGEFIVFQTPPVGTPPETGAPYWHAFGLPAPGMWA